MSPRHHDWTERAIAADPESEAYYRHFEWFCLWIAQGREWDAARGKLEGQAIARLTVQVAKTAEAFGAFGIAAQGLGRALTKPLGDATREASP